MMHFYELLHIRTAFAIENTSNLSMDFFTYFCYDNNHFFFSLLQRCTEETLEFTASILAAAASPDIISFAGGLPNPVSFPIPEMEAATKKVLEENGVTALQYSSTQGWPALRQWIAKRYETMGVSDVSPDDIIVTNGSQQALAMIGAVMINADDEVIVEDPTYLVALQSFHVFDPKVLAVTMNPDGIDCDELAAMSLPRRSRIIPMPSLPT